MTTNKYFKYYDYGREQDVAEDLIIESIKAYGLDVKYLPRAIINKDTLFGEDQLSKFNHAIPVEVYLKNIQGFEGEGDFLSKFNLEIRDSITFTLARKRFDEIKREALLTEVGYNYQIETANTGAWSNTVSYLMEAGNANNYSITSSRPMEGDLIYLPLNDKLYEIKFVEHENIFYQHGKLYTYDLKCDLFEYSSERLDTGNTSIDAIETSFSTEVTVNQVFLETGSVLLLESEFSLILEYSLTDTVLASDNAYIQTQSKSIVNWSEDNPWSEGQF